MANRQAHSVLTAVEVLLRDCDERSDGILLREFLDLKTEAAFVALVRRHGPMVLGVCRRILGNAADADDAAQATFLVLATKAQSLKTRSTLGDWLHEVARRTASDARRCDLRRREMEKRSMRPAPRPDSDIADMLPILDEELARLPEKYRLPIVLCDLEGQSRRSAAQQLRWPEGSVAGRLARGRQLLARRLTKRGVSFTATALATALASNAAAASAPVATTPVAAAAVQVLASGSLAGSNAVSAKVLALAQGAVKTMLLRKLKALTAIAILALGLAGGGGWIVHETVVAQPGQAQKDPLKNGKDATNELGKRADGSKPGSDREILKELGEKAIKAAGGKKLENLTAWSVTRSSAVSRMSSRIDFQLPDRLRNEFGVIGAALSTVTTYNGATGWSSRAGKTMELPREYIDRSKREFFWRCPGVLGPKALIDPASELTLLRSAKIGDRDVIVVKVSQKGAPTVQLSFDRETSRLLSVQGEKMMGTPTGDRPYLAESVLSDFREVDGMTLPHQESEYQNGRMTNKWDLSDYRFPREFDAKLFEKPAGTVAFEPPPPPPPLQRSEFETAFLAIKKEAEAKGAAIMAAFLKENDAAKNETERTAAFGRASAESVKAMGPAAEKALAAVRDHAADPAAVEALIWIVNGARGSSPSDEAAGLLAKHHLLHAQTIDLANRFQHVPLRWTEPLLRAQLASPDLVQGDRLRVLYTLAQVKQSQSELPERIAAMSAQHLATFEGHFGKNTLVEIRKVDVARAEVEAIQLFTELDEKYGSEKLKGTERTFGSLAKAAIFEMKHLSIGKAAPDILGEDIDGVPFKLSDYRGKVVVLSFWGTWCGACMNELPHEREIAVRLKDKPFALVGVNSDPNKEQVKATTEKQRITWRSFWCGEKGTDGEIPRAWNVQGWPTVYVIDHTGIIRAKQVAGLGMDRIVDRLIEDATAKK